MVFGIVNIYIHGVHGLYFDTFCRFKYRTTIASLLYVVNFVFVFHVTL